MFFKCFSRLTNTLYFITLLYIFSAIFTPIRVYANLVNAVFINEIHYDNTGRDSGEYVEIAGDVNIDLTGWSLRLYTGSNGKEYNSFNFGSWSYIDTSTQFDIYTIETPGIQNGSSDGIALFDGTDIIQFLSYEGNLTATDGFAKGFTSTDIGVSESAGTAVGHSLQLTGKGSHYSDFTWSSAQENTFGAMNTGQQLMIPVSEPSSLSLFFMLLIFLHFYHRGKTPPFTLSSSKAQVKRK